MEAGPGQGKSKAGNGFLLDYGPRAQKGTHLFFDFTLGLWALGSGFWFLVLGITTIG